MLALDGMNGSGQSGVMRLTAKGQKTEVVIDVTPGGAGVAQPVHIHQGTCDALGGVEYPLTAVNDGISVTTVDVTVADLLAGGFAINAHESGANAGNYVACGVLS